MNIRIEKLDDYGRGIAFVNNKITFIPKALENELVEYKIIKESKKYNLAKNIKVYDKNKDRKEIMCPYYNECGGCNLEHMSFSYENNFKVNKVKNILKKFANIEVDNLEIVSKDSYNYRNKITLSVKDKKIGLLKEKSSTLVEIDKCSLVNDKLNKVIEVLKTIIKHEDISKVMLRIGNKTDEVMISLDGNIKNIDSFKNLCDSLIINNKKITNEYITSYIGNKKFHIRSNSFFQINNEIVESLYGEVIDNIKRLESKNVLDLYCGVGTIGICISDYVDKVLGVEVVKEAVVDAKENKALNNVKNIEFINNKVENIIEKLEGYDTVIIDPPRKGLDNKTKDVLKKLNSKNIIYISCDPITLTRDLKDISDSYEITSVKLFNMFPRTYHVECVCVLNRL